MIASLLAMLTSLLGDSMQPSSLLRDEMNKMIKNAASHLKAT